MQPRTIESAESAGEKWPCFQASGSRARHGQGQSMLLLTLQIPVRLPRRRCIPIPRSSACARANCRYPCDAGSATDGLRLSAQGRTVRFGVRRQRPVRCHAVSGRFVLAGRATSCIVCERFKGMLDIDRSHFHAHGIELALDRLQGLNKLFGAAWPITWRRQGRIPD